MADWIWAFILITWKVYWPTSSQMLHGQKGIFVSLWVILMGKGIWWCPFISKGSSSFSSITVQPEPIPANEKLRHWRIYWGHCQFLQQMEEWGTLQRTHVSKEALWYFTSEPWTGVWLYGDTVMMGASVQRWKEMVRVKETAEVAKQSSQTSFLTVISNGSFL